MDKDLKDISDKVDALRGVVDRHIESTIIYREAQTKTLQQHSKEIWGGDNGDPGIKTKLDRIEQVENNRKWAIKATYGSVLGLIVERLWHAKW